MENKVAALQKSEAFKSMKGKLLTSLGEDISPLLIEGLKYSLHPTLTDAVLELSRSELLFVALLQALFSQNTVMSGRLLVAAEDWLLLPRISGYMGGKLMVEFRCTVEFMSGALEFAKKLKTSGLIKVSRKMLKYLSYLTENVRKEEIEAREQASRHQAVQKESASTQSPATSMANEDQIASTTAGPPTQSTVASTSRPQIAQGSAVPPMQSAAVPPMQSAAAPPMQSAAAPPMQSAAAPPMQSAAVPPMQSAAASTSYQSFLPYLPEPGAVGGSEEAYGQENQGAISKKARRRRSQKQRRSTDTQVRPITIQEPQSHDQVLRENASLALFAAVENNDPEATQRATRRRDSIDRRNASGFTPLHVAAARGHVKAMAVLLKRGADTEVVDSAGDRPLHTAAAYGMDQAVALLLVAGADINARGQAGLTPVLRAAGRESTTALLRSPAYYQLPRERAVSNEATKALLDAVRRNDTQDVRAAIENGADIDGRGSDGWTALHQAAHNDSVTVMCMLLRAGANKEVVACYNDRPLHLAAVWGHDGVVALLVVAGADMHSRDQSGRTPLLRAADRGHSSTAGLLRSLGG